MIKAHWLSVLERFTMWNNYVSPLAVHLLGLATTRCIRVIGKELWALVYASVYHTNLPGYYQQPQTIN